LGLKNSEESRQPEPSTTRRNSDDPKKVGPGDEPSRFSPQLQGFRAQRVYEPAPAFDRLRSGTSRSVSPAKANCSAALDDLSIGRRAPISKTDSLTTL